MVYLQQHAYSIFFLHIPSSRLKLSLQLLSLHTLPAVSLGDHLSCALTDGENGQHGVDSRHLRENTSVSNSDTLESLDLELMIHNGEFILAHITHLGGTGRVVDSVCGSSAVFGQLFIGGALGAGGDFALDPVFEGGLLGDLAGGLEAGDDGVGVVAFGVGEVAEVEGGLDSGVGRGEEKAAAGAWAGDVGGHAECIDGGVVAETRKLLVA